MKHILLFTTLVTGCAASLVRTEPQNTDIKTIGMHTGRLLEDGAYSGHFERAAEKACQGKPYKILERSRQPSTLKGMEDLPGSYFYWVIDCGQHAE
jgi:hypothetical protein